jgi:hypothetical protein
MSLYWFGPLESKTLRPILGLCCWRDWRWKYIKVRPCLPYIGWRTRSVDTKSSLFTTRKPISSRLQHYPVIFGLPSDAVDVLACTPSLISDKVVWRNLLEGLWDHRSGLLGPLSGREVIWWVGPTCWGWLWSWLVGTHGYPCLTSPWVLCRCNDLEGVMTKSWSHRQLNSMHVGPKENIASLAVDLFVVSQV